MREIPQNSGPLVGSPPRQTTAQEESASSENDLFVGRAEALALLERALEESRVVSRSVLVSGEAGVGKTRLVQEFARRAEARAANVAWGHCYDVEGEPPYRPFEQITKQRSCASPIGPAASPSDKEAVDHAFLTERKGDPEEWRERFLAGVGEALTSVAGSEHLLLVVEDIQWADIGSLLLLNSLVDGGHRGLLVISTVRSDEALDGSRRKLVYSLQSKSIHLPVRGLEPREVRQLVASLYGAGFASQREVEFLHRFTSGNPLFIRELLKHLRHEGTLEFDNIEQATLRARIPLWLSGLLDLCLAALPAPVRQVLSEASVLGDEFSIDVLASAKQAAPEVIEDLLDVAMCRGIVKTAARTLGPRFSFIHPLYRKRLYELFQPSLRRAFHAKVARAVIAREVELPMEEQAAHLTLAGEATLRRRAIRLCRRAATKAESVYAYEVAARFWELALQSASPRRRRERADLLARLGWARWAAREWRRAREAWKEAVGLFEELHDQRPIAPLALALGETARWQQDTEEAEYWLRRALSLLPSRSEVRPRALALLGSVACLRDRSADGMALLDQARRASASEPDPYALYWLSYGYLTIGEVETARLVAEKAFALAQEAGDRYAGSFLAAHLMHIYLSFLGFRSASRCVEFLRRAVKRSNLMGLSYVLISQSLLEGYQGHWKRVVRICERGMGELRLAGRYQFATSHFFRAEARLALGEAGAACAEMAQALPGLEQMRPAGALHLARSFLSAGEVENARRLVRRFAPALLDTGRMAAGRAVLGEVAARLGIERLAEQMYRVLVRESRPLLLLYSPVSVQRVLGVIAAHLENWPEAMNHFETAIEQLTGGGALGELVPTYLDYAEMRRARRRRGDLTKALALEARAAQLREQLGMPAPAPAARGSSAVGDGTYGNRFGLTGRELQVLRLVAEGRRNAEIAEALSISDRTVERHLENIMNKMGVGGRVEAVVEAMGEGLILHSHR